MNFVFHSLALIVLRAIVTGVQASGSNSSLPAVGAETGGVVYHFYCAVGDEGRVIGLAASKDLRGENTKP